MNTCDRRHVSVGVAVFDTFAGIEHCLFGFKLSHPSGLVGWEFTGGKVDPGEIARDAAVRETLEETGLLIQPTFLNCYTEIEDNYLCLLFGGLPIDGELKLREPHKHREWKWFPCDQPPRPLIPYAADCLQSISEMYYDSTNFHDIC